jgi:hypothetical protein
MTAVQVLEDEGGYACVVGDDLVQVLLTLLGGLVLDGSIESWRGELHVSWCSEGAHAWLGEREPRPPGR